jgi:hypothetical protein
MKYHRLLATILAAFLALPTHAAMLPGANTKEWPASAEHHQVHIQRKAADDREKQLIAAAEKCVPDAAALAKSVGKDTAGIAQPKSGPWWNKEVLGIRIPFAITADAIGYYSKLVTQYGQQKLVRFAQPNSDFSYHAKVTKHPAYEHHGKSLQDVIVVTMTMKFRQNFVATVTEAFEFEKSRTVVFDKDGNILGVQGDGDVEVPVMAM